ETIQQLITKRIGTDNFLDRIQHIYKTEYYTQASKAPEIQTSSAEGVFFDHEFTKLFKKLEAAVSGAMEGGPGNETSQLASSPVASAQNQDSVIASYKELIKDQDEELGKIRGRYGELETSYTQSQIHLQQQALEIQKLKDQLNNRFHHEESSASQGGNTNEDLESLRHSVANLEHNLNNCRQEIHDKEDRIKHLERELEVSQASLAVANAASILSEQDSSGGKSFSEDMTNLEMNELQQSKMALSSLQEEVQSLRAQNSSLRAELTTQTHGGDSDIVVKSLERKVDELLKNIQEIREEKEGIAREQDDLLVLLSDQDAKCAKYKERLKELGEDLGSDEDDDDDADDNDEEEESGESNGGEGENSPGEEIAENTAHSTDEKLDPNKLDGGNQDSNKNLDGETADCPEGQSGIENMNDIGTREDIKEPNEEVRTTGDPSDVIENGIVDIAHSEESPGNEVDVNIAHSEESPGHEVNHEKIGEAEGQIGFEQDNEGKTIQEGTLQDEKGVEGTQE
ncbi:general vesicular transport factor p115-like, partial [Paramuricea clavata]